MQDTHEVPTLRQNMAGLLVFTAFVLLCFFYGAAYNVVVFLAAVAALMTAVSLVGTTVLADGLRRCPAISSLLALFFIALAVSYQWSLSKDSSFLPSWSLALVPITFLIVRELGPWRSRLYAIVSLTVLCFALISLWKLLLSGEVASLPLTDPNNYGSFLYLTLIPWLYVYLRRQSEGGFNNWPLHIAAYVVAFVMFAATFATQSRTSAVIVFVALALYFTLTLLRRKSVIPVLSFGVLAIAAFFLEVSVVAAKASYGVQSIGEGTSVRLLLFDAALSIYQDNPLTGAGVFVFPLVYRTIRNPLDSDSNGGFAHNDYLQFLAEGGPLLVAALLFFALATVWRFATALFPLRSSAPMALPGSSFGIVIALGAVLAHAAVNFVMYTPVLALLIGLNAALIDWQSPSAVTQRSLKSFRLIVAGMLVWGWSCVGYLVLDTLSVGVFQRQAGIPFTQRFNGTPQQMLDYAQLAQRLNGSRGLPVFVEAAMRQYQLSQMQDSDVLVEATLDAYRRARATDPWNTNINLQMYAFVANQPRIAGQLTPQEEPAELLLQTIELDPVFVPGFDAIVAHYRALGREEVAYEVLRDRLTPWLPWLARSSKVDALRFVDYLQEWANRTGQSDYQVELSRVAAVVAAVQPMQRRTWFD